MKSFIQHCQVVTKNANAAQPVLKGVMHYEDGRMIVTDGFRLYRKERAHNLGKNVLLNPESMQEIDENYPETDRLIPDTKPKSIVELEINKHIVVAMKQSIKAAKVAIDGSRNKKVVVTMEAESATATFFTEETQFFKQTFLGRVKQLTGEKFTITFDYQLFVEALDMLMDDCQLTTASVQMELHDTTRPFILRNDYEASPMALITPIRKN